MKLLFDLFLLLLLACLTVSSSIANDNCVGITNNEYCLGEQPPNKSAQRFDDGIYIRHDLLNGTRKNTSKRYAYPIGFDKTFGMYYKTFVNIEHDKITKVTQTYDLSDMKRANHNKFYMQVRNRLIKNYGKPMEHFGHNENQYTRWVVSRKEICLLIGDETVSVTYEMIK